MLRLACALVFLFSFLSLDHGFVAFASASSGKAGHIRFHRVRLRLALYKSDLKRRAIRVAKPKGAASWNIPWSDVVSFSALSPGGRGLKGLARRQVGLVFLEKGMIHTRVIELRYRPTTRGYQLHDAFEKRRSKKPLPSLASLQKQIARHKKWIPSSLVRLIGYHRNAEALGMLRAILFRPASGSTLGAAFSLQKKRSLAIFRALWKQHTGRKKRLRIAFVAGFLGEALAPMLPQLLAFSSTRTRKIDMYVMSRAFGQIGPKARAAQPFVSKYLQRELSWRGYEALCRLQTESLKRRKILKTLIGLSTWKASSSLEKCVDIWGPAASAPILWGLCRSSKEPNGCKWALEQLSSWMMHQVGDYALLISRNDTLKGLKRLSQIARTQTKDQIRSKAASVVASLVTLYKEEPKAPPLPIVYVKPMIVQNLSRLGRKSMRVRTLQRQRRWFRKLLREYRIPIPKARLWLRRLQRHSDPRIRRGSARGLLDLNSFHASGKPLVFRRHKAAIGPLLKEMLGLLSSRYCKDAWMLFRRHQMTTQEILAWLKLRWTQLAPLERAGAHSVIRELNARGESLLPFLYTQLKGPRAQVSKVADSIRGLGMMGAVYLAKGLLDPAIQSAHKYILHGGLSWLGPRAIKAMPWLKKALAHKDPKIVFAALYALSSMGHWAMLAEPQLLAFATTARSPHQAYALMILLPHTHKLNALLPIVKKALKKPGAQRSRLLDAIGRRGRASAELQKLLVPLLWMKAERVSVLKCFASLQSLSASTRSALIHALERNRDKKLRRLLLKALIGPKEHRKSRATQLRDTRLKPILRDFVLGSWTSDDAKLVDDVMRLLGAFGGLGSKSVPILRQKLLSKEYFMQYAARDALCAMGRHALPMLRALVLDPNHKRAKSALDVLSCMKKKAVSLSHVLVQRPEFASKVRPSIDARTFLVEVIQALLKIAPPTRALGLLEATLHRTRAQAHPALRGWLSDRLADHLGKHSTKAPVIPILSTFVARIAAQKGTRWKKGLHVLFMEPPPSFLPSLRKLLPYLRRVARSKAKERHLTWAPLLLLEGQKASTRDAIMPLIVSLPSGHRNNLWFRLFVYAKKHHHIRKLLIAQLKSGTQQRRAAMLSAAHLMRGDWRPAFPAIWSFLRRSKQRPSLYARHLVARVLLKLRWPARWDAAQVLPLLRDPSLQVRAAAAAFVSRSPHHKAAAMAAIQQVLSSPETSSYLKHRTFAARAYCRIKDAASLKALIALFHDTDKEVYQIARGCLRTLKGKVKPIFPALRAAMLWSGPIKSHWTEHRRYWKEIGGDDVAVKLLASAPVQTRATFDTLSMGLYHPHKAHVLRALSALKPLLNKGTCPAVASSLRLLCRYGRGTIQTQACEAARRCSPATSRATSAPTSRPTTHPLKR